MPQPATARAANALPAPWASVLLVLNSTYKDVRMIGERNWARRRYPRVAVDTALRAHMYCSETSEITIRGRCRQFGEGGLGASMADQFLPGEVVTLELTPALKVYGVVRYMRGYFHGFEFIMLRDRQREALRAFYNSHAPRRPQA